MCIRDRPQLDESLRRWSYSSVASSHHRVVAELDATDGRDLYDAAALAEDDTTEEAADGPIPGRHVFGANRGPAIGNAIHKIFELAVRENGVTECPDLLAVAQRLLTRPLGPSFDGLSLDDFFGHPTRVARELRFTFPLRASSGSGVRDQLPALSL